MVCCTSFIFICLPLCFCVQALPNTLVKPEQVHLSLGVHPSEIIVTWVTFESTKSSIVKYGEKDLKNSSKGEESLFTDGGGEKRQLYIHRVTVPELKPDTRYFYQCGSPFGWSKLYEFRTVPSGVEWSPRLAIYGDMGLYNPKSYESLTNDVQKNLYDVILHVGDFAYDLSTENGKIGDGFMRMIEPVAAKVPYMTCPGNHEAHYNFSNYVNRFTMVNQQGEINNHFHSFNLGRAHIISFSTEFYYFTQFGKQQIHNQERWLENELKIANTPENRKLRPWIITMAHRPMYCSTKDGDDCTMYESRIRHHLEYMFYKHGVDLEIWAHEHVYERLFPVYNRTVYNGSYDAPYTNPKAPVHIITGSAGCQEYHDRFVKHPQPWSAFRSADYGYTRMIIINSTHIYTEQFSENKGKVIDNMMLIKDRHGPEAWL